MPAVVEHLPRQAAGVITEGRQSICFDGMAGESIWGYASWVVVPHDPIRGDAPVSNDLTDVQAEHIAMMVKIVIPTP